MASLALVAVGLVLRSPDAPLLEAGYLLAVVANALVGGLVAARRPANAVGWLFLICAICFSCYFAALSYAQHSSAVGNLSPLAVVLAWMATFINLPGLMAALGFLPLVFPSGRLLNHRWRLAVWYVVDLRRGRLVRPCARINSIADRRPLSHRRPAHRAGAGPGICWHPDRGGSGRAALSAVCHRPDHQPYPGLWHPDFGLYALVVGYLGALFQDEGNWWASVVATGVVAVLFQPLRVPMQRGVNRLIYGGRDDPYAVIAQLGQRLEIERRTLAELARQVGTAVAAIQLTEKLQRSRERLVLACEEEQRRLRNDLHDGLGPHLAALALKLDTARNKLAHNPQAEAIFDDLADHTQRAVADIRRVVYALRPPSMS